MAKKLIISRRRTNNSFLNKLQKKHLSQEERELDDIRVGLEEKIPDTVKRLAYIKALSKACIITCDICEDKEKCDKEYKDCKFNPINGG